MLKAKRQELFVLLIHINKLISIYFFKNCKSLTLLKCSFNKLDNLAFNADSMHIQEIMKFSSNVNLKVFLLKIFMQNP